MRLKELLEERILTLAQNGFSVLICGGALGFDMLAAETILRLKRQLPIQLKLAIPYPGHGKTWSAENQTRYQAIMRQADECVFTSEAYHPFCMQTRNRYMVDHSDMLLCYLTKLKGGTAYTAAYALKQNIPIENLAINL